MIPRRLPSLRAIITVIVIFIVLVGLLGDHSLKAPSYPSIAHNRPGIGKWSTSQLDPLQSPQLVTFWKEFQRTLLHAKPRADPVKPDGGVPDDDMHVDMERAKTHPRLDITRLSNEHLAAMKQSHKFMVEGVQRLVPHLPYDSGSRGIVMSAGGSYFGVAITSVRMLRRSGSQLPVEVFIDNWADYDMMTCERILPSLNAKCRVLSEIWSTTPSLVTLQKYQYKVFAILFSSFEDVLFLDADAFPAHNPDGLLDVEPYRSNGLVTWPDFWASTASHHFYDIAGVPVPPLNTRRSSESGIMLWSKQKHADSLLLATYYNYYGPKYYYPLLSQGASGEGDKETFLHAALVLQKPFFDVRTPVSVIGRWINGTWYTAGMKQGDPVEDYALQHAATSLTTGSHPINSNRPTSTDGETEIEAARTLFIHNNIVKLDAKHLFDEAKNWHNETGHLIRLWGDKDSAVDQFGFDIERVLWEELVFAACDIGGDGCEKTRDYFRTIFPDEL
jgi:alpha 1,2-mannosyltransferase